MCGITGFIDFKSSTSAETLALMTSVIQHRGPDDEGLEIIQGAGYSAGLGFRRLAILDLSPLGHQPMFSQDRFKCIAFNGEIYNFKEIRAELEAEGNKFYSHSDTEVILQAFEKWGIHCVDRFIGMYAIALLDTSKNEFYLIRDRAGVKPMFYSFDGELLLFASELKSLHKHPSFKKEIDLNSLSLYFQHGYISAPYSIFKGVNKMTPGHFLKLNLKTKTNSIEKYWDVIDHYNKPKLKTSFKDASKELETLLHSAFNYRMISDVPIGVFLSGGYDSSAVTAILQKDSSTKIKTFSIGFHEAKYNEAQHAKAVAKHLGTEHSEEYCSFKEALDIVPLLPEIYDEPNGDSSAIPTTLVSRMARKHVTVALSADGGDEIFAGYPKYFKSLKFLEWKEMLPVFISKPLSNLIPNLHGASIPYDVLEKLKCVMRTKEPAEIFNHFATVMTFSQTQYFIRSQVHYFKTAFDEGSLLNESNHALSRMQAIDYKTYLSEDILHKVDRAAMSVSLENREPFMDHRITEYVAQLPSDFKFKNGQSKFILRDIVHRYIPVAMMDRPKMGFMVPVEKWCHNELRSLLLKYTSTALIKKQGILNPVAVENLVKDYFAGKKINFQKIWFLLMFQMWYERWMED